MGKVFAFIASALGTIAALGGSQACWLTWADEPEMPKSLIK